MKLFNTQCKPHQNVWTDNYPSTTSHNITKPTLQSVTSKNGKTGLFFEGCLFYKNHLYKTSIEWRCSRYRSHECKMCCKTTLNLQLISSSGSHTHDVEPQTPVQQHPLPFTSKKTSNPTVTTSVQETAAATPPHTLNELPSIAPLDPTSSVKKMLLVDPDQWKSLQLNNGVTSTLQRDPFQDQEESTQVTSGVASTSQKDIPNPKETSIALSENILQNVGQILQNLDQTLQNKLNHHVDHVYPKPQLSCENGLVSADSIFKTSLESSGSFDPEQTNEMSTQTTSEGLNITNRSIALLSQPLPPKTSRNVSTTNYDSDIYSKPQLDPETFLRYLALVDSFRNKYLEKTFAEPKQTNEMVTQTTSEYLKIDKRSATSEVNSLKRRHRSLKRKFNSLKCKYSDHYKVLKKTYYVKQNDDFKDLLVFVKRHGEYDFENEKTTRGRRQRR